MAEASGPQAGAVQAFESGGFSRGFTTSVATCWEKRGLTGGRMFKFPQMDFEMAIWEMTSLLFAPKKVFKSMYYHVSW